MNSIGKTQARGLPVGAAASFAATRQLYAGAAVATTLPRIGLSDLKMHEMSWLAGYTYVGNGTLGATDAVYCVDPTKTYTMCASTSGAGNVPIAPADSIVGASYTTDLMKHFSRLRVRKQTIQLLSLNPNTSNSMVVVLAPQAGGTNIGTTKTDTTAGNAYTNVISMDGAVQIPSWASTDIDCTWAIAGGQGSQQNEFQIGNDQAAATALGNTQNELGIVPTTFAVSGNSATTALRGTLVHAIIVRQLVDLIDFIGGQNNVDPIGLASRFERSLFSKVAARDTRRKVELELSLAEAQRASRESTSGPNKDLDALAVVASNGDVAREQLKDCFKRLSPSDAASVLASLAERL